MHPSSTKITELENSLEGQFLIAMPSISEGCFARSVVFVCAHSNEGAMGLIINLPAEGVSFEDLLRQLEIIDDDTAACTPTNINNRRICIGGPVSTSRGFVLHSSDYFISSSTVRVRRDICLTSTLDILKAISNGGGPKSSLLTLGYSGWSPGQLEDEFANNGWLNCPADPDLIFDTDHEKKYDRALSKLGINSLQLSDQAGHA